MKKNNRILSIAIIAVILVGIFIKFYYIHYTPTWVRQHDVIGFGAEEGHAAYIEYILNNRSLPDFDPRERWGFFQPPLHHIISAVILFLSTTLGFSEGRSQENIQIITALYMVGVLILSVCLYNRFSKMADEKRKTGLITALLIVAVHPMFTIMAGSINNDALALFLSVLALYFAVRWYENPSIIKIVPVALSIGFAMTAKLTGGLVAVPVGVLMLIKLIEAKNSKLSKTILQYVIFAVIVFPIGLWWSIRNIIKWDMPINYIPPVGEQLPEDISLFRRIFDFKLSGVYPAIEGKNAEYSEFNVIISIIKTSLFGEWDFSLVSHKLTILSWGLFIFAVVLAVIGLIATVYMTFSKNSGLMLEARVVLFGTWITYLMAYLSFALGYNNFSAEDFRYAAICIVCEGIFIGLFYERISSKIFKQIILGGSTIFALLSVMVYFIIGLKA